MTFTCLCETQKDGTKGVSSENCEKCNCDRRNFYYRVCFNDMVFYSCNE